MAIIIIGKTASGKDSIANRLVSDYGYKRIVTYTTRPMREGEVQNVTYHFVSNDEFDDKVKQNFFAEWKQYNTEFGIWYYGTALEDLINADENTIVILTPDGYRDVLKKSIKKPTSIYIYANNETIKKRLLKRGDDKNEAQRRLNHDNIDFNGIQNEVDKIIYNNDETNIEEVVHKIVEFLNERRALHIE